MTKFYICICVEWIHICPLICVDIYALVLTFFFILVLKMLQNEGGKVFFSTFLNSLPKMQSRISVSFGFTKFPKKENCKTRDTRLEASSRFDVPIKFTKSAMQKNIKMFLEARRHVVFTESSQKNKIKLNVEQEGVTYSCLWSFVRHYSDRFLGVFLIQVSFNSRLSYFKGTVSRDIYSRVLFKKGLIGLGQERNHWWL
jgi:hypothetical protein